MSDIAGTTMERSRDFGKEHKYEKMTFAVINRNSED